MAAEKLTFRLPLHLIKSEIIPPAPTRSEFGSEPVADFLFNFSSHSWIVYGASPLLVISHFPNPLSDAETKVGPIYRQVIELDLLNIVVSVNAVGWSPVTPSLGELAVAWNDCVGLFSCDEGSFCWRQTTKLQQSTKVEAIKWTGSGDGIISGGAEVVMWRRQDTSWEIAWKFKPDVPQALVSTTWSAEGLSATAPYGKLSKAAPLNDASNCVLVFQGEEDCQYPQTELRHPVSVTMIQWRPLRPSNGHSGHALRPVLLTCCVNGSVRLWSEIDDGRIRRTGRDNADQKSMKLSFCVVAVVEVNKTLNGLLGSNVFVSWATEIEGVTVNGKEAHYYSRLDDENDTTGRCEWLVGCGPKRTVTLWAVHCLDDTAPVRFPRITLCKKQELVDFEFETSQLLLNKVFIMRNRVFGPPLVCSLVHLLDCNYFSWTLLNSGASTNGEEAPAIESAFLSYAEGILKVGGHTGKVVQIAIHPFSMDFQIAASLDANGMLLFWSYLTFSDCHVDPPTSTPSWKLCGESSLSQSPSYTCLRWAPVALGKDRILFMGHTGSVDCFIVTTPKIDDVTVSFHYLFSTPFKTESREQGLTRIDLIPLHSNCDGNFISTKFLLVALWMDGFQALSWELTFQYDLRTSESAFFSNKYSYSVNPCSSIFPSPHDDDKVTICAVVCPIDLSNVDGKDSCSYAYHLITGCSNGSLKLWRSMSGCVNWALVGMLNSKQSPIVTVSCSACCRKIATGSTINHPRYSATLCIWECMQVHDAGGFLLEHELLFDVEIVALNWLVLGNGQLLLGVCLRNELRVYAQSRCGSHDILKQGNPFEGNAWVCIAVNSALPAINDFCWGPKATVVAVHDGYFSLFNRSLMLAAEDDMKSSVNIESWQHKGNLANKVCFCSMAEVAEKIGGSVYLFHPESLLSSIYSGNWKRAFVALRHLVKHLGNNSEKENCANMHRNIISPVPLSNYLEGILSPSSGEKLFQWSSSQVETGFSQFAPVGGYGAPDTSLSSSSSRSEFTDFIEAVERLYSFKCITEVEKMQTFALIDLLQEISNPHSVSAYGNLDEPGRMFWVAARFQQLFLAQRFNRPPLAEDFVVSPEMIGWAFHSDCRDNLFSSLLSSEPSWVEMRSKGAGFWYTDATQLRAKMERLARLQYMKNRDPKACTLLYIALKRIQVLAGLFKISKDERDKPLSGFLSRNFQEDKNKAAALKNAYVLLGKHQLELAIAFFLLGGDASSAVTVCVKNLGDEQLALVICRLVEGFNGSLEHSLITKILLPSALEKGDFWMASLLEWILGNYSRSYFRMLGFKLDSELDISVLTSLDASFMDPNIGQYCLMLATKTSMKNAIGENNAAVLCGWAALMSVTSFSRSGLPLEALECLASSVNIFGRPTQVSDIDGSHCNSLAEMLKPSVNSSSSNWISDTICCYFISHSKLSLTMQYISKLLKEHPSYIETYKPSYGAPINQMADSQEFEKSLKEFREDLTSTITYFEQKFSMFPLHLIRMIVLSLHHFGMEFIGHFIMEEYMSEFQPQEKSNESVNQSDLPLKAAEEFSCIFVKYIATSCQNWSHTISFSRNTAAGEGRYSWLAVWGFSCVGIARSFQYIRAMFRLFLRSHSKDHMKLLFNSLGLFEYLVLFASSCLQRNEKALAVTLRPIFVMLTGRDTSYDIKLEDLDKLLIEIVHMLAHSSPCTESGTDFGIIKQQQEQNGGVLLTVLEDKRWPIISSSLWVHMCTFLDHQLDTLPSTELDNNKQLLQVGLLREFVKLACADVSYYCSKHFASYLLQEINVTIASNLPQLEDSLSQGNCEVVESVNSLDESSILFDFEQLLHICADTKIILGAFSHEYHNWQPFFKQKSSSGWIDAYIGITREFDSEETSYKEDKLDSPSHAGGSPLACLSPDDHPFKSSSDKDLSEYNKVAPFHSPKEVHKRNGELLEALCLNSTDECQAGLASNKKGIIFFNWDDGFAHGDKSEYIWGKADWPHNGWAGSKSDPVPTCVSPGVGLGRKMGTHLGLGGATIGDLARPGRHVRGGGLFDVSSNADMEASGLGWGVQENFDEFVDPPATVDNVKTSAFASHPSRPFFLVGSSNTHIYLWKFGKDTATATYGVLPAANVAPPYALASISSVRFDHCGQRFVTGALDGTVCTWQIEVGGRNNVHPTESSSCFNNHTSDVTYVTASGSIVAAAGHSSSGVNVVVWDTLAPPSTSQASIMCHEGGARSLSVFDNDIGSGSISPLILTGGKNGDVGLHDFRYIATGRTKRQKQSDSGEQHHNMTTSSSSSSVDMRSKTGDQNRNGMLWYIPKAHSGSVTKISTIPNTSFFLTGSKDGDVKLWDAKRAKLVFHWPRLHDRHTFLQPSTRGFGGVVRAGVTDIQVVSHGFLSCGGDGSVKFVRFKDFSTTN